MVKLFTDVEYRHRLSGRVDNPAAEEAWDDYESQSPSVQSVLSRPIIHRMRHFYRYPTLYWMMCHPQTLDLTSFIADKRIILISLKVDERKVPPPEQQLLGAVLVSQLQMAAMASGEKTTPFFLYIDEVQNFVTTSLDMVLAAARKCGLHLTMANQFLGQLKGTILESVIGNVGATVVFQIGLNDARLLAPYFQPEFTAENLVNLDLYNTAIKMRLGRETLPAFSLQTRPPPGDEEDDSAKEREEMIRQRSVERYTPTTLEEVKTWLKRRYQRPKYSKRKEEDQDQGPEDWVVTTD